MVQISETLEGAFPAFRCRVNVVLLDPHTAITRDLLDSEGICASFTKPGQKRVAQAVYHALIRKVQMPSHPLVQRASRGYFPKTLPRISHCFVVVDLVDKWVYKTAAHLPNPRTCSGPHYGAPSTSGWEPR